MTAAALPAEPRARSGIWSSAFVWLSVYFIVVAVIGFGPSYWIAVPAGQFRGMPLLHVHAAAFVSWLVLFASQSVLAARGHMRLHRAWGVVGVALASAMVFLGLAQSLATVGQTIASFPHVGPFTLPSGLRPEFTAYGRAFLLFQVAIILQFAVMVSVAIAFASRPDVHKRLLALATLGIIQAGFDRIFGMLMALVTPAGGPFVPPHDLYALALPTLLNDFPLLVLMIWEWRSKGRVHPAWVWGGAAMVCLQLGKLPLAFAPAWQAIADWLLHIAG